MEFASQRTYYFHYTSEQKPNGIYSIEILKKFDNSPTICDYGVPEACPS